MVPHFLLEQREEKVWGTRFIPIPLKPKSGLNGAPGPEPFGALRRCGDQPQVPPLRACRALVGM